MFKSLCVFATEDRGRMRVGHCIRLEGNVEGFRLAESKFEGKNIGKIRGVFIEEFTTGRRIVNGRGLIKGRVWFIRTIRGSVGIIRRGISDVGEGGEIGDLRIDFGSKAIFRESYENGLEMHFVVRVRIRGNEDFIEVKVDKMPLHTSEGEVEDLCEVITTVAEGHGETLVLEQTLGGDESGVFTAIRGEFTLTEGGRGETEMSDEGFGGEGVPGLGHLYPRNFLGDGGVIEETEVSN